MDTQRLYQLLEAYAAHATLPEEERELFQLFDAGTAPEIKAALHRLQQATGLNTAFDPEHWQPVLDRILATAGTLEPERKERITHLFPWTRIAAAAAIAGLLLGGYWLLTKYGRNERTTIAQTTAAGDIAAPATSRATITLAGGRQVFLDSANYGALAQQGNAQLVKEANGQVAYKVENIRNRDLLYNTLTNPRGSRVVTLTLSDGTRVWLNAASSLRYPVIFTGDDRTVEMSGEGYFEVTKNASKPFQVKVSGETIDVLGTGFDVNAYEDEPVIKTTLLEGSIRVTASTAKSIVGINTNMDKLSVVLTPGEQAQLVAGVDNNNGDERISVDKKANIEEALAWKNGLFAFHDADLPTVMRQLARWYDVDVHFDGTVPDKTFGGSIGRTINLSAVILALKENGVDCRLDGKTIEVTNKTNQ